MRYIYGTNDSFSTTKGTIVTAKQLASIIKKDVEFGKWNRYEGGRVNSVTAHCRYKKNGYAFHSHLLIYGSKREFKVLENIIKDFIEVIPRQYS